jgi:plastocyanin domain-containing protein
MRGMGPAIDEPAMKNTMVFTMLLASALGAACKKSSEAAASEQQSAAPSSMAGHQMVAVTVGDNGFNPNQVEFSRGKPAMLTFQRTTDATCAQEVVFPELGIKKPLPLNQPVVVQIPTDQARTFGFECGMGMYKSQIVVR